MDKTVKITITEGKARATCTVRQMVYHRLYERPDEGIKAYYMRVGGQVLVFQSNGITIRSLFSGYFSGHTEFVEAPAGTKIVLEAQ